MTPPAETPQNDENALLALGRSLVMVGLMGAGKSSVGRRLARILNLPFVDADEEVERAAGCSIEDIFRLYGEAAFRDGEERVIARLLESGPQVLATGGGAYMNPRTRERIRRAGISVWLRADLDLLVKRTSRRGGRPLLAHGNPRETLEKLIRERYPVYAEADITVDTTDENIELMVDRILASLKDMGPARLSAAGAAS
ncbi:MAG: shikimate kinase [Alphaproteobacteria bacterium]|nr:shikimate kinase [Alphaproteobacteria bacterium]